MRHSWIRTYRQLGISLAVLVLTLFGLAAPASAADQVPFSASLTAVVTSVTRLPGGVTQLDLSYSGTATHLGDFTGTGTNLVDNQGNFTLTACLVGANGTDSVCHTRSGHFEDPQGSCVVITTSAYTVTGGTGAFANATGGGTITWQTDFCAGTASAIMTGTISQPHSG
jgi:hypothetical protein